MHRLYTSLAAAILFASANPVQAKEDNLLIDLPNDKIVFAGYSGKPERDKEAGFTVGGPFYKSDAAQTLELAKCKAAGLPALAQITFPKDIFDKPINAVEIDAEVAKKIKLFISVAPIYGWCIQPEETRPWKPREVEFVKVVAESIRKHDPKKRIIFHYQPNHRNAKALRPSSKEVDIVGKGCYTNIAGYKNERSWIRWSVEQMLDSMEGSDHATRCWALLELCKNPAPEEEELIRAWVRHDVYLSLASGAKGVLIWSLHPRKEVKKTFNLWYDAYSECAKELNQPPYNFGRVILRGKPTEQYTVSFLEQNSDKTAGTRSDSTLESNTSEADEGKDQARYPLTYKAFSHDRFDYLIIINSTPKADAVKVEGVRPQQKYKIFISDDPKPDVSPSADTGKGEPVSKTPAPVKQPVADQTPRPINLNNIPLKPWEVLILILTKA